MYIQFLYIFIRRFISFFFTWVQISSAHMIFRNSALRASHLYSRFYSHFCATLHGLPYFQTWSPLIELSHFLFGHPSLFQTYLKKVPSFFTTNVIKGEQHIFRILSQYMSLFSSISFDFLYPRLLYPYILKLVLFLIKIQINLIFYIEQYFGLGFTHTIVSSTYKFIRIETASVLSRTF